MPAVVLLAAGCGDGPTEPMVQDCTNRISLLPGQVARVSAAQAATCFDLAGEGARYLVVPQYATRDEAADALRASGRIGFRVGAPSLNPAPVASLVSPSLEEETPTAQERLDRTLRLRERALAGSDAARGPNLRVEAPSAAVTVGSTRAFKVLNDLDGDTFTDVNATLRFEGSRIQVYVDDLAPASGLTSAQLDGLGRLFDTKLHPAAIQAFGNTSDIDNNGRVVVLLTPVVNRLTTATQCASSGYVTGFFYGLDLLPTQRNSNKGEIFYALVPDPSGTTGSCRQSVDEVLRVVPSTFIHELQHMISWNQKVIIRGSRQDEELWLNEGLSHIAEEIGSLLYEVPCRNVTTPPCRTSPAQLFPDSSQGFIVGNFTNAYRYLANSTGTSLVLGTDDASLSERGAGFLFLRWLGDQKGPGIYRRLVESPLRGVRNVEDRAGEPWERLFGDFFIATYAVEGLSAEAAAALDNRYRFLSRDLRAIFRRLYETNTAGVNRPFPIVPVTFPAGGSAQGSMVPGTATWYELVAPTTSTTRSTVDMVPAAGGSFDSRLGAQVSVLRLR